MPDWQRRVIRRAFVFTIEGMSAVGSVEAALAEELAARPGDENQMRREMQTWLRNNAIAQANGTWSIEAAARKLLE